MSEKEVKMLVQLRSYAIKEYQGLAHKGNPTAMMREMDSSYVLSSIINSIDDILKPHVTFEKKV